MHWAGTFAHGSRRTIHNALTHKYNTLGPAHVPLKSAPSASESPSHNGSLAVFAQHTCVTNRHTDHTMCDIYRNRPHWCTACRWRCWWSLKTIKTKSHQPRSHLCTVPKAPTNCWMSSLVVEAGRFLIWSRLLFLQPPANTTRCTVSATDLQKWGTMFDTNAEPGRGPYALFSHFLLLNDALLWLSIKLLWEWGLRVPYICGALFGRTVWTLLNMGLQDQPAKVSLSVCSSSSSSHMWFNS